MPPKKNVVEEKPVILGRMGTNLKCGIVGLPNVGKSTLFNALTRTAAAQAANYPFCTIDPNEGIISVPDDRLDRIAKLVGPQKVIPAMLKLVDIAGIVKGLGILSLKQLEIMSSLTEAIQNQKNVRHREGAQSSGARALSGCCRSQPCDCP